jgi:alcohol dehydrogenase class IV
VKGERPYMTFQPEKSKDAIVIYVATTGSGSEVGNFTVKR